MVRRETLFDEGRAEDGREGPADVVAEGEAEGSGAGVGHPVALGFDGAARDGVGEGFEAGVGGEGFVGDGLGDVVSVEAWVPW